MPHQLINPDGLLPPGGFSHTALASPGRTLHLGGQKGHHADGSLDHDLPSQFGQALANLRTVPAAAGARPVDLASLQLYVTDAAGYRESQRELGRLCRNQIGRHFPAMALLKVSGLHDPHARVEIVGTAVIPDDREEHQ